MNKAHANADAIQVTLDHRAHLLDQRDVILDTAKEQGKPRLSDRDAAAIVSLEASVDTLNALLGHLGHDPASPAARKVPNINVRGSYSVGADVTRDLDALLWATAETVPTANGAHNPVDQVVVRSDVGDPGKLAPRINAFAPEHREVIRNFQQTVSDMAIFGLMVDSSAKTAAEGFQAARQHRLYADQWKHIMNALDVDTSTSGADWVPTGIGATMHEKVRASGKVAPLFRTINLPSNPWKWPVEGGDAVAYRVAEPTSDTASKVTPSTPGTAAATFDAEIFGARTVFSRSVDADSAVAMVPFVAGKLVRAFSDGIEKAILDGDTDGTHMDADAHAAGSTDVRWSWDGLRKRGLANANTATTTTTAANLAAVRKLLGIYGADPGDCAFIIGVSSLHALLADTSLLTVDKLGPNATILNGQIGTLHGIPVVVSEHIREDLNASGVHDGITTTKSWICAVHRPSWAIGQRMALDVAIDDSIYRESFQRVAVAHQRLDVQNLNALSADDTAVGYNLTSGS